MLKRMQVVLAILLMTLFVGGAAAQSAADISRLAAYFPAETPVFASVRTDDGFIDGINALIDRLEAMTGDAIIPAGFTLMQGFDFLINESIEGGNFDNVIRSWLGSSAAVGVLSTDALLDDAASNDNQDVLIALEITEAGTAQAFIEEVVIPSYDDDAVNSIEIMSQDTFTVTEVQLADDSYVYYAVYRDLMLIASSDATLPFDGFPTDTLANDPTFSALVESMPADVYNGLVYLDLPTLIASGVQSAQGAQLRQGLDVQDDQIGALRSLIDETTPVVVGATIQGDASLTLDIVQIPAQAIPAAESVNPDFARYIPAGTPLVVHGRNLRGGFDAVLTSLRQAADVTNSENFTPEQIDQSIELARGLIQLASNLDLDADILDWMTGDFALTLSLNEQFPDTQAGLFAAESLPVDFALLIQATDAAKAQRLVDGLEMFVTNASQDETSNLTVSSESVGAVELLVVIIDTPDAPFDIVLAVGADAEVFALGTLDSVRAAFLRDNTLADDPNYQEAAAALLPSPSQIWYFAGENLQPVADLIETTDGAENADQLRRFLTAFHSSSISTTLLESGAVAVRAVMTLP